MQFFAMALRTQAINRRWPSRKTLVPKVPSKNRSAGRVSKRRKGARVKKDLLQSASCLPQELSFEQLEHAKLLASIVPGQQRSSAELLERMIEKRAAPVDTPGFAASPPRSLTPLADTVPTSPSPTPQSPEPSGVPAWEAKALKFIRQENLSMDKEWKAGTWKQKSSMEVRLKLLKDDGYDIAPLQGKGVSSDQITYVLLARIEAHKKRRAAAAVQTARQEDEFQPSDGKEITESVEINDSERKSNVKPAEKSSQPLSGWMNVGTAEKQACQLFDPPPMAPQKRKHDHQDDHEDYEEPQHVHHDIISPKSCSCGPEPKKIRISTPEELRKKVKTKALDQFRRNISRDIFRSSNAPTNTSRIVFKANDPSPKPRAIADAHIGSRGFGHIIEELKWLGVQREDGVLQIHKVKDFEEDSDNFISVFKDSKRQIVIEGDSQALTGLMDRLRKHDLMYTSMWTFDDMQVVPKDSMTWSLSQDTVNVLTKIEKLLVNGAAEVVVEEVYNGKIMYPE